MVSKIIKKIVNSQLFLSNIDFEKLDHFHNLYKRKKYFQLSVFNDTTSFYSESNIVNKQGKSENIYIGKNSHIRGFLLIYEQGGKIEIGDYCYIGDGSRIWSAINIKIGNNVLIAHNVNIHDNISHPVDSDLRHKDFMRIIGENNQNPSEFDINSKEVIIKDNAWIGFNSIILKGVTIGEGAIVGAGSVVTKDIPDYAVVVGNPAIIIKYTK